MIKRNYEELFIFNRMVGGDKDAFRFFFDKYYTDLCNLMNFYLQNPDISEEIVQDIFVYFWEKKRNIEIQTSIKSYLIRASKNKGLNYLRNEKARLNIQEKIAKINGKSFDELPENSMDVKQLGEIINKSVNSLPPKCREIFILAKEKELSYIEIAGKLGISVKTVENQMGKALKNLREILRPYYNEIFTLSLVLILSFT